MLELFELTKNGVKFYIPVEYLYNENNVTKREDENAKPPKVTFNKILNKWKLDFDSADIGGYDVERFHYYFDTREGVIKFLFGE